MKIDEVEKLLTAYYDGRTTEEEEKALRVYFETQQVPDRFQQDKQIFLSFRPICQVEAPADLETKLANLIDAKAEEEKRFLVKNRNRRSWKWVGGVAASLLLLIVLSYGIINLRYHQPKDTFNNPEEAYQALHILFIEMSDNMNDGIDKLADSRQEVSKINKEIKDEIYN